MPYRSPPSTGPRNQVQSFCRSVCFRLLRPKRSNLSNCTRKPVLKGYHIKESLGTASQVPLMQSPRMVSEVRWHFFVEFASNLPAS